MAPDTGENPSLIWGVEASGNRFDALRIQPHRGRFFHPSDEHGANSAPYIVLSYAYRHSHFHDDRGMLQWISSAPTFDWPFDPGLSFITMAGLVASLLFFETPLAAALRSNVYPPLLLDLEADRDTDHVIAIYRTDGCWGAVAKSNYTGANPSTARSGNSR